ncbi:MAG: hypothetical protein M1834_009425 [Cirrosporium novae-zelandiae]|nr:MAG: hypothetical protein M1834_009425 [Cirrosporium novae-zelandiae]
MSREPTEFELSEINLEALHLPLNGYDVGRGSSGSTKVEAPLPLADGGKDAWMFLAGCFLVEALVWGFPFSFGVFQDYYATTKPFAGCNNIAVIGTVAVGIMYLGAPLTCAVGYWPKLCRWSSTIGLGILLVSLIWASFSDSVIELILSQGLLYGIGGGIMYAPTVIYLDEWFDKKKGLAFGVMWAGTGTAGLSVPFLMNWLLTQYHFRTALRIWAIVVFLLSAPFLYHIKPRVPSSLAPTADGMSLSFLKNRNFTILQLGNILEGLGYFIPSYYLPTYATSLHLPPLSGTTTVALVNVTAMVGCTCMGHLIDRLDVCTCMLISTVGSTLSIFLLWGLATSFPLLCIFSLAYGLFAGSFSSTWCGVLREVRKNDGKAHSGMVFGFLAFGRGVGSVVSGPLGEALVAGMPWKGNAPLGYGTGYGPLMVFSGVSAAFGCVGWVARKAGWI